MHRRKVTTSLLNFNRSSTYIPLIIEACRDTFDSMEDGREGDFQRKMDMLSFLTFCKILFGSGVQILFEKRLKFIEADGSVSDKRIFECFLDLCHDLIGEHFNPLTGIFPVIAEKGLYPQASRNNKNKNTFFKFFRDFLRNIKDRSSVAALIKEEGSYSEDEILHDLVALMLGGAETSSHTLTSVFYYLKKYPHVMEKLKKEFQMNGISKEEMLKDAKKLLTMEKLQSLDYLTCVIKETLRYDPPITEPAMNLVKTDTQICGVPIPKGTHLTVDIF